jgi:hypothetical protein
MQTSKSIEEFFLDDHSDSDLWDWEGHYRIGGWQTILNWSSNWGYWLGGNLAGFRNWLYLIYYGLNTKRLGYHRCRTCNDEIDQQYMYDQGDLRSDLCLVCYDIECQKIIDSLTID